MFPIILAKMATQVHLTGHTSVGRGPQQLCEPCVQVHVYFYRGCETSVIVLKLRSHLVMEAASAAWDATTSGNSDYP
jgi:hypothetical protein